MVTDLRNIIEGHTPNAVDMKSYGCSSYPIASLNNEIVKLKFKELDLSAYISRQKSS